MGENATENAIDAIEVALHRALGSQLLALYLYGSLAKGAYQFHQSDVNLLVVVEDDITIHDLREVLRPVWSLHRAVLRQVPVISTRATLQRHMRLDPVLAQHLTEKGRLLIGKELITETLSPYPVEVLANTAHQAMRSSSALAPDLLSEHDAAEALADLRSLARRMFDRTIEEDESPAGLLATIQYQLSLALQQYPEQAWSDGLASGAPPLLEDLQAIYETERQLTLVLPDLAPDAIVDRINTINWRDVAKRVADEYWGLRLTTVAQLRTVLQYETPADYHLRNYAHAWGLDALSGLFVPWWRILRDLARMPSEIQIAALPHAYIASEDNDLSIVIHDFQNKLLNIQLRNELLGRQNNRPSVTPSIRLPDRTASLQLRIDAIFEHLDWWADFYTHEMETARAKVG